MCGCEMDEKGVSVISGFYTRKKIVSLHSGIQIPNTEVQVSGEGEPEQIGDLKFCRKGIPFSEGKNHGQYKNPKKDEPQKRKNVGA